MIELRVDRLDFSEVANETRSAYAACLEIRRRVFIVGQGVCLELEFDGLDDEAEHFVALRLDDAGASPIGTARMRRLDREAKAERVAVLEEARGTGAGRELMLAIESRARSLGLEAIILHAQVPVIPFYERLGYQASGEVFNEADIPHRSMRKPIA